VRIWTFPIGLDGEPLFFLDPACGWAGWWVRVPSLVVCLALEVDR